MDAAQETGEQEPREGTVLEVRSLTARGNVTWTIHLESDILSLAGPGDRSVLKLHREEAARYMRFAYDILRGRTISFIIIEGLKRYSFKCSKEQASQLFAWLPSGTPAQMAREIRFSGIGLALFGILHLILADGLFWGWGIGLLAVGALGVAWPRRWMFLLNGILMLVVGLLDVILSGLGPRVVFAQDRLVPVAVGSALIFWGIQQISMLGANQRLRAARAIRDERVSLLPAKSRVVRRIVLCNTVAAVVFGLYTVGLLIAVQLPGFSSRSAESVTGPNSALPDIAIFGVLTILTALSASLFSLQKRPPYFAVKVSAQMLITIFVFLCWGIALNFDLSAPLSFLGNIFFNNLGLVARPYVWIYLLVCVLVCVLVFNRWFTRAVDKELEEQRD